MNKLKCILCAGLTALSFCPTPMPKALAQVPKHMYVNAKDYTKPFPINSIGSVRINDSTTMVDARRFYNKDIDSITFRNPKTPFLNDLGKHETLTAIPGAAVLDISERNSETESTTRNVYSAWYMLSIAGMPLKVTTDIDSALADSRLVVLSSVVKNVTFTENELQKLTEWIGKGGILVMPAATPGQNNNLLKNLVGYDKAERNTTRNELTWNQRLLGQVPFEYVDTDEERTISIGNKKSGKGMRCYSLTNIHDDADTLATYNTGEVGAVRNTIGNGAVYSYGLTWGELIQRSQFNRDNDFQRSANNTFEPSADVIAFQIRSLYNHQGGPAVWKFTIPDGYESILIPTHDCDSKTALDSMYFMSEYEKGIGAPCQYFITTHYYAEPQDSGEVRLGLMYSPDRIPKIRRLIENGHTIGSHSIGHFPDFNKVERFPMTVTTRDEYHALYSNRTETTTGGSTWAEIVLSKLILQEDIGNNVLSLRTGHLCMNDSIPHAEQIGEYKYASCFSASDVMSEFPYQERIGRTYKGEFNGVLEMPLHFSDVFNSKTGKIDATNWQEKVKIWKTIHEKLTANYAPAIILIHPNRKWKMEAEKALVETYDHDRIGIYNFEAFGNFWNVRQQTEFSYGYDSVKNTITIHLDKELDNYGLLPFAIEGLPEGNQPTVHLTSPNNTIVAIGRLKEIANGRYLCVF